MINSDINKEDSTCKHCNTNLSMPDVIVEIQLLDKVMYSRNIKLRQKDNKMQNLIFEKSEKNTVQYHKQLIEKFAKNYKQILTHGEE